VNKAENGGIVVESRDGVRRGYSRRMGREDRTRGETITTHHFFSKMIAVVLISDPRPSPAHTCILSYSPPRLSYPSPGLFSRCFLFLISSTTMCP